MHKKCGKKFISFGIVGMLLFMFIVAGINNNNKSILEEKTKNKKVEPAMASYTDSEYHTYYGTRKF